MTESSVPTAPVLVDTDIFSKVFAGPSGSPDRQRWSSALAGRTVVIAVQTEVELRVWPQLRGWGEARTTALLDQLDSLGTIQVNVPVQDAFVSLTVWARENGHAIGQSDHVADRWIAASALAYDLELASGDGIHDGIRDLVRLDGVP